MSLNESKDIEIEKNEELKQNDENKNDNNKNFLVKFMALKNALIEERKKTSLLEKDNKELKEQLIKNNETILELKDEIKKYHDAISKKGNSNFFSELFNGINLSEIKNEATIEKLNSENFSLKQDLLHEKDELNTIKNQLEETLSKNQSQKIEFEKKIQELESEKENLIIKHNSEKEKSNKIINDYDIKIKKFEETIKKFTFDRAYFEEKINKLKKEIKHYQEQINQKNEEFEKMFQEQENIINNNSEFKLKVKNLKDLINQYKKAIDNCTEITDDYIFIGKLIPNTHYNNIINIPKENNINDDIFLNLENKINDINKKDDYKKIKIMFDFYKRRMNIKIEKQKMINIDAKDIIDIVQNLHVEGQIKIFYKIKDSVFDYLCQFTKKESEFLIYFYKELKTRNKIDPALIGLSMGTI